MKNRGNRLSTNAVSELSKKLHRDKVYNRANFYWYVLEPLVELGFFERRPFWNDALKKTQYSYVAVKYDLPRYPISSGYMRDAYFLCREWNDYFFDGSENYGDMYKNNWKEPGKEFVSELGFTSPASKGESSSSPKTEDILQRSRPIRIPAAQKN